MITSRTTQTDNKTNQEP